VAAQPTDRFLTTTRRHRTGVAILKSMRCTSAPSWVRLAAGTLLGYVGIVIVALAAISTIGGDALSELNRWFA